MYPVIGYFGCMINIYMSLYLAVERFSFSLNDLGEKNPGCKNFQMSLIVVNLSETLLGGIQ